jgi:hypothetical protein
MVTEVTATSGSVPTLLARARIECRLDSLVVSFDGARRSLFA